MKANDPLTIEDVVEATGATRRAIRFYIQRGLLPPPDGRGRGASYRQEHIERLRTIARLQEAGHPLTTIKALLDGDLQAEELATPSVSTSRGQRTGRVEASQWLHLQLQTGISLQLDLARHQPTALQLADLQDAIEKIFGTGKTGTPSTENSP